MASKNSTVDVCVLLATFRRSDLLRQTLASIADQQLNGLTLAVIVVDNASDAATKDVAEAFEHRITGLQYVVETRPGKSAAINRGLDALPSCELLVFTDDDIVARPDWIAQLWAAMHRWPDVDIFGGRIIARYPPDSRGLDLTSRWLREALAVENEDGPEREVPPVNLWGPNLAVRARVMSGGIRYDEARGPAQGEYITGCETEFTNRLASMGAVCVFVPQAVVQHVVRQEQLETAWLCRRSYKHGREHAAKEAMNERNFLLGVPRWVYRKRVEWLMRGWIRTLSGESVKAVEAKMIQEFLRGTTAYYRQHRP